MKQLTGDCEALIVSKLADEGAAALKRLYRHNISSEDFLLHEREFKWLESRITQRKPVNVRLMRSTFPDFDFMLPGEELSDLAAELKEQRAFTEVSAFLHTMAERLERGNAGELAAEARDELAHILRVFGHNADVTLEGDVAADIEEMRAGLRIAKAGEVIGIPTDIPWLDHHWGGMCDGQTIVVLGRPGSAKSYFCDKLAWAARKYGHNVGLFSPEMSVHEQRSRIYTLASAEKQIQQAVGLERSFRNRALMQKRGLNLKQYSAFLRYLEQLPGRIHILTQANKREKMSVGYIESRIEDYGLDMAVIDPIYLLKPVSRRSAGWEEIQDLSIAIEALSEQYNIPIVVSNQANNKAGNTGKAPGKDFSYNGDAPVQVADYVIGVKHFSEENLMHFNCSKSRFGGEFYFEMTFFPNTGVMRCDTLPTGSYFNGHDEDPDLHEMVKTAVRPRTAPTKGESPA